MKKEDLKKVFVIIILVILTYELFCNDTIKLYVDRFSMMVLLGLETVAGYFFLTYSEKFKKKYLSNKSWILVLLVAFMMAFMIAGQPLFLNQTRIYISLGRLLLYALYVIWCIPVELLTLAFLEKASEKIKSQVKVQDINQSKKVFLVTLLIFLVVWTIVFIGMYPGTLTSDSIDQYLQAFGVRHVTNAHPALITLLIRVTLIISKNPAFYIYLQIIFTVVILSSILTFLYKNGLSKRAIYVFSILFAISPSSYMIVVSLWKDVIFTIALLWLTFLLLKMLLNEKEFFAKRINYVWLIVATILVSFSRHNGIGPFVFVTVYFVYRIIRTKSMKWVLLSFVLILLYGGISFAIRETCKDPKAKEYPKYSNFLNLTSRSSGQILQTTTLPVYTDKIMKKYSSLELLRSEYDPYSVDSYGFNEEIRKYQKELGTEAVISTKEALLAYGANFIHHPSDTIKERLDGTDIMWSMVQPAKSFNHRYAMGIWLPADMTDQEMDILEKYVGYKKEWGDAHVPDNKLYKFYTEEVAYKVGNYTILDNIISRGGIHLILLLIVSLFIWKNRKEMFLIYLPMLGNTATWVLLLAYQAYRYIWYIPVTTLFILLFAIVFTKQSKINNG